MLAHHDPGGGTQRLLTLDPVTGAAEEVASVEGTIHQAGYRADGLLWLRTDSSVAPPAIVGEGDSLLRLDAEPPPADAQPMAVVGVRR